MAIRRTFTSVAALLACATAATAQAPANDNCANAIAASVGSNLYDLTGATTDGLDLDPLVCDMSGSADEQIYQDIWFTFVAPTTDSYEFDTSDLFGGAGTTVDTKIAVYDQATCPDDPANVIACDDDQATPFFDLQGRATANLVSGNTYFVRLGTFSGTSTTGTGDLFITATPPPPTPPANDACVNAAVATVGVNAIDSTAATMDGMALDPLVCSLGNSNDDIFQDVWYTFTPATTDFYDIEITNNGGTYDSRLAIYDQSGCPDDPALVLDCDDDSGPGLLSTMSAVSLVGGNTYLIRGGTFSATTLPTATDLLISVVAPPPPPPANDDCANAAVVGLGLTAIDTINATDGAGLALDPLVCDMGTFGDEQIYQDIWFTFTPASSGSFDIAIINNGNPTFDSRLAIYNQSTCPDDPANVIGCDDDTGPSFEAAVNGLPLSVGTTYLIRGGSFNPTTTEQPAALSISAGALPPVNDDCANATPITMHGTFPFDNSVATTDGPDLAGLCDFGVGDDINHNDVWFEYTPSVGGCTYISTLNMAGFDTRISIYNSSTCPADPATILACSDEEVQNPISSPFEAGLDVDLTAGVTYLIGVGNFASGDPGGSGSLLIAPGPMAAANDQGMQTGAPGCSPGPLFSSSCNGDGGNQMGCTDCPCGNNALPGTIGGCINSSGGSTSIDATGDTSVSLPSGSTTDLRLTLSGAPAGAFCVLLSGGGVAPAGMMNPCFGLDTGVQSSDRDGLRCAIGGGQAVLRHGGRSANGSGEIMDSSGPSRVWGGEAQPAAGIAGQAGFSMGQTRFFQVTHREDALAVCMRGLNTSQALEVMFTP